MTEPWVPTTADVRQQIQDGARSPGAIDGYHFDLWLGFLLRENAATALERYAEERWGEYGFGEGRAMRDAAESMRKRGSLDS